MMQPKADDTYIKRMADLLRRGATLTDLACPNCGAPLFRLQDGTLWCGRDEKKVVLVREGEQPPQAPAANPAMEKLEATLTAKVQDLQGKIEAANDPEELIKLSSALNEMLNSLEKIRKMKKS
jgi:uncharacterized Zn finger protein (UPF0148 family)